jgi:flagellum-specific ATP synthase
MSLCERAGPGSGQTGDITAVFSVLVAGSDMDEPIADILRGVLDGHVVLDRNIAERGRFPAVDVQRSVSRSLPSCATEAQNKSISAYRSIISTYAQNEMMINAGLYAHGANPVVDHAIAQWPDLDAFAARPQDVSIEDAFSQLDAILRRHKPVKASKK